MKTSAEYLTRMASMRNNVVLDGELIGRDHPRIMHAARTICKTFDWTAEPKYERLLTAVSHLSGATINRFTHIHQTVDDLLLKQEMTRTLCSRVGGCIQRCMGIDALNALSVSTKNADLKYGTDYHTRFINYMRFFQENDLVGCAAQTDAKGDRRLRPGEQPDPDQYLRVVERRPDGVVVRGAKLHNTMAPYADEIIAFPTRALKPDEKDYAIAFAVPADTEGIYLITRFAEAPPREPGLEAPFADFVDVESFTVFDDVFVPNERIFINGETEFGGETALLFALYHRHSYCGCKPGIGDMMTGIAALAADYNGVEKIGHIRDKLADMLSVGELVYAAGIASAVKSIKAPSGTQLPDIMFANVGRRHAGLNMYHEANTLIDITGGLPATLPLSRDYKSELVGDFVRKYTARRTGIADEDHYRIMLLASDLMASDITSVLLTAGVHGGGSPQMEDVAILMAGNLEKKKDIARYLAGIESVR